MYAVLPIPNDTKNSLPILPVTLGIRHTQETRIRPNGALFHHFLCVSEGEGFFEFNGKRMILGKGSTVFIKKNFPVAYGGVSENFKTSWVTFDGHGVDGLLAHFNIGGYAVIHNKSAESQIEEMIKLSKTNFSFEILSSRIYSMAIDLFVFLKNENKQPILKKAKNYIESNYQKDVSIEEISKNVGMSQSLLFKLFRTEERTTPMKYLQKVRIEKANAMLIKGDMKIYEIAKACGFSDVAYFCKVYRNKTGYSPTAYKRALFIGKNAVKKASV